MSWFVAARNVFERKQGWSFRKYWKCLRCMLCCVCVTLPLLLWFGCMQICHMAALQLQRSWRARQARSMIQASIVLSSGLESHQHLQHARRQGLIHTVILTSASLEIFSFYSDSRMAMIYDDFHLIYVMLVPFQSWRLDFSSFSRA